MKLFSLLATLAAVDACNTTPLLALTNNNSTICVSNQHVAMAINSDSGVVSSLVGNVLGDGVDSDSKSVIDGIILDGDASASVEILASTADNVVVWVFSTLER